MNQPSNLGDAGGGLNADGSIGAKPVAFHAYLTDSSGRPLAIYRMTHEHCTLCPSVFKEAMLGVVFESKDRRSETVQCLRCDYVLTRPYKDPPGRRMNQGLRSEE